LSRKYLELKKMEEELRTLSFTDPLTGLHNRRGFLTLGDHLQDSGQNKVQYFCCMQTWITSSASMILRPSGR
jgi:GGDEF domain-containing protein